MDDKCHGFWHERIARLCFGASSLLHQAYIILLANFHFLHERTKMVCMSTDV